MIRLIFFLAFVNIILWNAFMPVFELPSEQLYFYRVYEIYTQRKLPNLFQAKEGDLTYPDTYTLYLTPVMALFQPPNIFYLGTREFNSQVIQHLPVQRGRFNRFYHPVWERTFHWNKFAWSVHTMRFFTSLFYLLAIWLTHRTTKKMFAATSYTPHAILFFTAFHPKMIHRATSLVNLPLLFVSFSLFYFFALTRNPSLKTAFLLGLSAGLGIVTKVTGYNLILFFFIYLFLFVSSHKQKFFQLSTFSSGCFLVTGWYFVRNWLLYGNPIMTYFTQLKPPQASEAMISLGSQLNYWYAVVNTTWQTFWDGFGWENIIFSRWIYWLINLLTILAVVGLTAYFKHAPRELKSKLKFLLTTLIIYIGVFLVINLKFFTPQGKDFMPVVLPISLIYILGLNWWRHQTFLKRFRLPIFSIAIIAFIFNIVFLLLAVVPTTLGEKNISQSEYYRRIQPGPIHQWLLSIWKSWSL